MNSTYVHCESKACHLGTVTGRNMEKENTEKSVHKFVANVNKLKAHFAISSFVIRYRLLKA